MRPQSIKIFDLLFWIAMIAGIVVNAMWWGDLVEQLQVQMASDDLARAAPTVLLGALIVTNLFFVLLWFLISRVRSNIARWLYVIVTVFTLLLTVYGLQGGLPEDGPAFVGLFNLALAIAACWMLFRADASAWFRDKKATADSDIAADVDDPDQS